MSQLSVKMLQCRNYYNVELEVTGTTTLSGAVNATSIEVPNVAVTTKLGVGTTETPVNDIQVTKTGNAEVQITSTGRYCTIKCR